VKSSRHRHYHRIRTLPNALSAARVVLALVAAVVFLLIGPRLLPVLICVFASLLDILDGWLARRRGEVTRLGEHLDPLADKILITVIFLALVWFLRDGWIALLVALLLLREWGITWLRQLVQQRHGFTLPADRLGKWKMLSESLSGNVFLFWLSRLPAELAPGRAFITTLVAALAVTLLLSYAGAARMLIRASRRAASTAS
jgi:CDP-diacylglycerol--glycerol-3-phosphate 3-phosphatidyltransferase